MNSLFIKIKNFVFSAYCIIAFCLCVFIFLYSCGVDDYSVVKKFSVDTLASNMFTFLCYVVFFAIVIYAYFFVKKICIKIGEDTYNAGYEKGYKKGFDDGRKDEPDDLYFNE